MRGTQTSSARRRISRKSSRELSLDARGGGRRGAGADGVVCREWGGEEGRGAAAEGAAEADRSETRGSWGVLVLHPYEIGGA